MESPYCSEFNELIRIVHSMVEAEKKTTGNHTTMKTKLRTAYEAWVEAGSPIEKKKIEETRDWTCINKNCPIHG